jgi:hypothetical protein
MTGYRGGLFVHVFFTRSLQPVLRISDRKKKEMTAFFRYERETTRCLL